MALHFIADSVLVQNGAASITSASVFPILPNGASIGQVFVDVYQSGSVSQGVASASSTFSYISQSGGITQDSTSTLNNLTGVAGTETKVAVTTLSWTSGVAGVPPAILVGFTGGVPLNDYYVIQYLISYN